MFRTPPRPRPLPDLIWVEQIRNRFLILMVYRPRLLGWPFSKRVSVDVTFTDGPIVYESEEDRLNLTDELIENGVAISEAEDRPYLLAYSLDQARSLIEEHWGVTKVWSWRKFRRPSNATG